MIKESLNRICLNNLELLILMYYFDSDVEYI